MVNKGCCAYKRVYVVYMYIQVRVINQRPRPEEFNMSVVCLLFPASLIHYYGSLCRRRLALLPQMKFTVFLLHVRASGAGPTAQYPRIGRFHFYSLYPGRRPVRRPFAISSRRGHYQKPLSKVQKVTLPF